MHNPDRPALKTSVAVRVLCEFTAKAGDLDLRFTPSATALEGIASHALVATRRGPGYESEVSLSSVHGDLTVRGRADGFDAERGVVEEVKTYRGDLGAMHGNRRALHWAQAKVYGWMLCEARGLAAIDVALVYVEAASQEETVLVERVSAPELRAHFERLCVRYVQWGRQEAAHRQARDLALASLTFPLGEFREGQRRLSESVYKAAVLGRCLLAQAPTGIGKTLGTLFPMFKAMPGRQLDKVMYMTAKGPGRALALEAARTLQSHGAPIRVLEMVAREKACLHPGSACHGDACPKARGFFDRLADARNSLVDVPLMDQAAVRTVAEAHDVCPVYLSHDMVRWSDLVVGDYNYWFDANAMLHGMSLAGEWKTGLLVDEAHNLVERARAMYTIELRRSVLVRAIGAAPVGLVSTLSRLDRAWDDFECLQWAQGGPFEGDTGYWVLAAWPDAFAAALKAAIAEVAEHLAEQASAAALPPDSPLLRWHFDALRMSRLLESFGEHSLLEFEVDGDPATDHSVDSVMRLRNVVPASFVKPRLRSAATATLFSGTLTPMAFYADMLGLPDDAAHLDVPSPFKAEQLRVEIVGAVSTRLAERRRSLAPIVRVMAEQFEREPGNYLAFFSSFEYMEQVSRLLASSHPGISVWKQARSMRDADRQTFLRRFEEEGRGIGFAVLGGAFGEGIDLPGRRLVGAFIATLGLPPSTQANEQTKARMEQLFAQGYDYTYLYPGVTKVVQAAGRVIRGSKDRGTVHLIDDRYEDRAIQALLPSWWDLSRAARPAVLPQLQPPP